MKTIKSGTIGVGGRDEVFFYENNHLPEQGYTIVAA